MNASAKVNVEIIVAVAKAQGYRISSAERAAKRGLRWVRQVRNQGTRPPRHIAQKLQLLKVTK